MPLLDYRLQSLGLFLSIVLAADPTCDPEQSKHLVPRTRAGKIGTPRLCSGLCAIDYQGVWLQLPCQERISLPVPVKADTSGLGQLLGDLSEGR